MSRDGTRFARAFGIYGSELEPVRTLPFPPFSTYTTGISPDGSELYISNRAGLIRARVAEGQHLGRIPLPPIYNGVILFSSDGRVLYAIGRDPEFSATRTQVFVADLE